MSQKNQTVLVTGAEGALGSKVAERFLDAGHTVLATWLREPSPDWKKSERLIPVQMDVTRADSIRSALQGIAPRTVESWIHCAGGFRFARTEQVTDADLDFLLNINFKSAFLLARELLPPMRQAGFGRIVLVSARATLQPGAGMGLYAASKAALNVLAQSLAEELRGTSITVNAVLPSIIDTPANRKDMPGADFSTWVTREQLSEILLRLTEPAADPIHGALIPVAGRV